MTYGSVVVSCRIGRLVGALLHIVVRVAGLGGVLDILDVLLGGRLGGLDLGLGRCLLRASRG